MKLDAVNIERYAREISLPEIGREGVERLLDASVLIIGAGALGTVAAMYLAAAGVGHIGIADFDIIGLSNLQRQLSFTEEDLGRPKALTLGSKIKAINSDTAVEIINKIMTGCNLAEYLTRYDIVVECSDNPATKYLVTDTARRFVKPCIIGSVKGFIGQITTQIPEGPSYRDIFPDIPKQCDLTLCAPIGVLGPVPGIIASLQATEVIKIITGSGRLLSGRLLQIDTLSMTSVTIDF